MENTFSEKKQIFIGSIISYASLVLNILIAIFFTPFLLKQVGDIEYGIRNFSLSFVTYASVIGTGIATAYLRFANLGKNKFGDEGVKDVDGAFLKLFTILGILTIFVGLLLSLLFGFKLIPLNNYTSDQILIISIIVFLSFIIVGFKLPLSLFVLVLNFKKRFIFRNSRYLLASIFEYGLSTLFLILGLTVFKTKIIPLSFISLASELAFGFLTLFFLLKKTGYKLNFKLKCIDKSIYKEILIFSLFSLLIVAVISLNDSTDKIILGFISPAYVTIYSLTVIFNGYIKTFADTLTVSFTPRLTEAATKNEIEKVQSNFNLVMKISTILLSFIVFGYLCCGREFIILWVGEEKEIVYYYSIPLMIGIIFLYPQHFSIQIHHAYGKQKFAALIFLVSFLLNVGFSILLINVFSSILSPVLACIIGTTITYIIELISLVIYNEKKIQLKQRYTYINIIINVTTSCLIAGAVFHGFKWINLNLISSLLIKGFAYVLIMGNIQYFLNKKELKIIFGKFRKKKENNEKI